MAAEQSKAAQVSPEARAALARAVTQFNAQAFWECHETLEDIWIDEQGPLREFYHGFIQAAAGFVHVQRHNWYGAVRLLGEAYEKLAGFGPECLGVELTDLLDGVAAWRRRLAQGGPDGMPAPSELGFPLVRYHDA